MKVIVTGAASFIGSAVVRQLLDKGNYVCAVVRPGSESTARFKEMLRRKYPGVLTSVISPGDNHGKVLSVAAGDKHSDMETGLRVLPRVIVVELDLQKIDKLPEILTSCNPALGCSASSDPAACGYASAVSQAADVIVNADLKGLLNNNTLKWDAFIHAGWEGAGSENRAKENVQNSNVTMTLAALNAAAELGCGRFLFTGSQAEYGICSAQTTEETSTHPVSPYGKAKVAVSAAAVPLSKEVGIEYVHARLYSIYGPGDHPWSLVNSCLRAWKKGRMMELGPCTQLWNFLHVNDAAAALCTLINEGGSGFYNIAGEDTKPLSSYIREMADICSSQGLYTFGDRPQNVEGAADLYPDISRIKRDTSWRPKVSFKEGISEMWEEETTK